MTKKNFRKLLCVVLSVMLFVSNAPFTGIVLASDISRSQPEEGSLITENTPQTSDVPLAIEDVATEPIPLSERLPQFSEYELALADMCDYPQSMRGQGDLATTSNITYPITNLSGSYYINHTKTGFFLRTSYPNVSSSYYYEMDETEYPWTFEWLHTNRYIIYSTNHQWDSVSMLRVMNGSLDLVMYDEEPPNECIWEAYYADFGGVTIKNLGTGLSLHMVNGSLGVSLAMPSTHADYDNWVWGIVSEENFSVPTDITINDDWVIPCISKQIFVSATPSNTPWTTQENFTFSITPHNPGNTFTVNEAGEITSSAYGGTAILTVTHKPTRLTRTFRIASGFVREGIYRIQNKRTERYIDLEGPSMGDDAPIQQWQYHIGDAEEWRLTIHEAGDYSIQSLYSGKYWHVYGASVESGAGIVQYTGSSGANSRWKIEESGGGYKISPYSALNMSVSVPLNQDGDGVNLIQLPHTNDSNYSDVWKFHERKHYIQVNVQMDGGYVSRYVTATNAISHIKILLNEVGKRYLEEHELWIDFSSTARFTSYADTCSNSGYNQACNCGTCENSSWGNLKNYHHKNIYNILLRVPQPNILTTVSVSFIGHVTCKEDNHPNPPSSANYGLAYKGLGLISITNFLSEQKQIKTVMHEIGHMFYMPDHYGGTADTTEQIKEKTGITSFNKACIYGEDKEKAYVLENYTICEGCQFFLQDHIARFSN